MRAICQLVLLLLIANQLTAALGQTQQPIVVTAPAKMKWEFRSMYLCISNAEHSYEIPWGCPPRNSPTGVVSLQSNRVYTFTVVEEEFDLMPKHPMHTNILIPRVLRIEDRGKLVWDHEICEVHKSKMVLKTVRIVYGYGGGEPRFDEDSRLFPHRCETASGGCVVTENSPKATKIYVCSQCKEAFKQWWLRVKAPDSVLPQTTRYDHAPALRGAYLESFRNGYADAWGPNQSLPVFAPTSGVDKARVFGYSDGVEAGRAAAAAWSAAASQR
ncbi:MAG TPA: hypothetical protein VFA77_14905 [Candidatus Eisenbacteria bacterium]|jgi:hypothetical protein|nr:hypothetical protein [Candidatus Eisenbacteria bacterium]